MTGEMACARCGLRVCETLPVHLGLLRMEGVEMCIRDRYAIVVAEHQDCERQAECEGSRSIVHDFDAICGPEMCIRDRTWIACSPARTPRPSTMCRA